MSNKKFIAMLIVSIVIIFSLVILLNIFVNPFGAFDERYFNKNTFNFTNNPRVAKMNYLEGRRDDFDSFIVGSSGAAAIDPIKLGEYTNTHCYNLFYYGSDLLDSYDTIKYLLETRELKEIFLGINYTSAMSFNQGEDQLTHKMPYYASGTGEFSYYKDFIFANPQYSVAKLRNYMNDSYYPRPYKVFIEETGVYDKRGRDSEAIGHLDEYLDRAAYEIFKEYPETDKSMEELENFGKYMKKIKDLLDDNGVKMTVAVLPVYKDDFKNFNGEELETYYRELAEVTDFWDFSKSSISRDPRYFYDPTHVRNTAGDMILAKIYGEDIYMPDDFGHFVSKKSLEDFLEEFEAYPIDKENLGMEKDLPILMFHHFGDGEYSLPIEDFEDKLLMLKEEGYETVSLEDIYRYVFMGVDLPEKPILITFDDGYMSNYSLAFPFLKKEGMKAVIYTIGSSFGKETYKDTGKPIIPHFGKEEAQEMLASSLIEVQSHSFDMHQSDQLEEKKPVRINVKQFEGESEEEYIRAFFKDFDEQDKLIKSITGKETHSFSYPTGYYTEESEILLWEKGIKSTITSDSGVNVLVKGLPQSLYGLKRFNVTKDITGKELLKKIIRNGE